MKKLMAGIMFIVVATALVGCETMKGAGKDIQGGGRSIERVAAKAQ